MGTYFDQGELSSSRDKSAAGLFWHLLFCRRTATVTMAIPVPQGRQTLAILVVGGRLGQRPAAGYRRLRLCLSPAASQHCCLSISYSECLGWSVWEGLHHLRGRGWGWFDGDRLRGRRLKVEELRLKDCVYPV